MNNFATHTILTYRSQLHCILYAHLTTISVFLSACVCLKQKKKWKETGWNLGLKILKPRCVLKNPSIYICIGNACYLRGSQTFHTESTVQQSISVCSWKLWLIHLTTSFWDYRLCRSADLHLWYINWESNTTNKWLQRLQTCTVQNIHVCTLIIKAMGKFMTDYSTKCTILQIAAIRNKYLLYM